VRRNGGHNFLGDRFTLGSIQPILLSSSEGGMSVRGAAGEKLQELQEEEEEKEKEEVSNRHLPQLLCRCQATQCTLLLHHLPPFCNL